MSDALKKFLASELEELKRNKIRATALVACVIVLLIFWIADDTPPPEEISLNEPTIAPVTKDLPAKPLPVEKSSDGVTLVTGANSDPLIVADPFAVPAKPKPSPPPKSAESLPPIPIQPPKDPPITAQGEPPKEKILLTGTATSGENKMAMFLLGDKETIFLKVGEKLGGRQIVDIGSDFVIFDDGECLYLQGG